MSITRKFSYIANIHVIYTYTQWVACTFKTFLPIKPFDDVKQIEGWLYSKVASLSTKSNELAPYINLIRYISSNCTRL